MVVVPTGKIFPDGTPLRATLTLPALSAALALPSCASVTRVPHEVAPTPVLAVTFAGAVSVGAVVSLIVNAVVAVLTFPTESVAVIVIVCTPTPTSVPASGLCVSVTGPQLSLAVAVATTLGIAA